GDCVFYNSDRREAYATRVDEYLTVYFTFEGDESIGCKLKYVSRLIDTVRQWSRRQEEGIFVSFDPSNVSVKLSFLMQAWLQHNLPLTAELKPAMDLMDFLHQLRS